MTQVQQDLDSFVESVEIKDREELIKLIFEAKYEREKWLLGRVLTIIDAVVPEDKCKPTKDLVHDAFCLGMETHTNKAIRTYIRSFCEDPVKE